MHPDHYYYFFSFGIRNAKERKANFNTNDRIFTKKFHLPFGTLLSAECSSTEHSFTEYNSTQSLTNKYKFFETKSKQTVSFSNISKKHFSLTPSKKYILIEELKDKIKGLKNILVKIKKTRHNERIRNE